MTMIIRKTYRYLVLTGLIAILPFVSAAQSSGTHAVANKNSADLIKRSSIEVDPATQALNIEIPLQDYPGRGISMPATFYWNSKVWRTTPQGCWNPPNPDNPPSHMAKAEYAEKSVSGWSSSFGVPYIENPGDVFTVWVMNSYYLPHPIDLGTPTTGLPWDCVDDQADPSNSCFEDDPECVHVPTGFTIHRLLVHMPNGATHELRQSDTAFSPNGGGTGPYRAVDSSRLVYDPDNQTLWVPDGSRYVLTSNVQYIDKNGNTLTFNASSKQWTDTLGRTFSTPFSVYPNSGQPIEGTNDLYLPGINGNMHYQEHWEPLANSRTDPNQPLAYSGANIVAPDYTVQNVDPSLFGADNIDLAAYPGGQAQLFNPTVLTRIDLPNGQSYKFSYNIFGEIDKVILPTGGYKRYRYEMLPPKSGSVSSYEQTNRGVVEMWESPTGDPAEETTHHWQFHAETDFSPGYWTTVTAPDGSYIKRKIEAYLFHTSASEQVHWGFGDILEGKTLDERSYSSTGQMLRRTLNSLASDGPVYDPAGNCTYCDDAHPFNPPSGPGPPAARNPKLVSQTEILLDTGGNALAKKTSYEYDPDLNTTAVNEYDFVSISQATAQADNPTISQGNLLRRQETTYLVNDSNIPQATRDAYRARNLVALPTSTRVKDANGVIVAQSAIRYDETALTSYSNVTNWVDPGNGVPRGNTTTASQWLNTTNTLIETHAEYDQTGNVVKTIDANGNASTIGYADNFGAPDSEATTNSAPSQLGGLSTFAFVTSTTTPPPFNWTAHFQYDYFTGAPVNSQDINGVISKTIYNDALDRPTQTVVAIGTTQESQTTIGYYDSSHYIQKTSDLNTLNDNLLKSVSLYDGLGRTTETRSYEANGNYRAVQTQYDPLGRVYELSNPFRPTEIDSSHPILWTTSTFDALGRMIEVETPDGAKVNTAYDGNRSLVSDQAGKKRISKTNALGQLTDVWEVTASDGSTVSVTFPGTLGSGVSYGYQTSYSYDILNNLLTVAQGGQTRTFTYNSLSRLLTADNPESGTISFTYDSNGSLKTKRDARNIKTVNDYDELGRLTKRCYRSIGTGSLGMTTCASNTETPEPNTSDITYTHEDTNVTNLKGVLTKVANGTSTTEYTAFDILGRVTAHKQTTDGTDYTTGYRYKLSGALDEETYPSTRVVKNVLDAGGGLSIVESKKNSSSGYWSYANSFTYNAAGAVTSMQLGNGSWESTTFNNRLQPMQIALGSIQNGYDKLKLNYTYESSGNHDDNGDILTQTITIPGMTYPLIQNYTYDSLNRLASATETSNSSQTWKQEFSFDRYGNRNFVTGSGHTTTIPSGCGDPICNPTVSTTTNQLTSSGYSYDSSGNTTADAQSRTFVYDGENKQTSVSNTSGTIGQYYYDGNGKRVKKYVPSTNETTIFVYDVAGKQIAEYSTIVANSTDAKVNYLTADHLGSPRINTDANGAVIARHDYHPFGEEIDGTGGRTTDLNYGDDTVRKQFTGYERDNETSLDYAKARMFGYTLGRFTSPDPLAASARPGIPQSWNRYAYVLNNPLVLVDRTGKKWGYYDLDGQRHFHWFRGEAGTIGIHKYSNYTGSLVVDNTNAGKIRLLNGGGYQIITPLQAASSNSPRPQTNTRASTGANVNHAMVRSIADHTEHVPEFVGALAGAGAAGGIVCFFACPAVAGLTLTHIATTGAAAAPEVGYALSQLGEKDQAIFSQAISNGAAADAPILDNVSRLTDAVQSVIGPFANVNVIGNIGGQPVYGSAVSRVGIASVNGVTVVIQMVGDNPQILGPLQK